MHINNISPRSSWLELVLEHLTLFILNHGIYPCRVFHTCPVLISILISLISTKNCWYQLDIHSLRSLTISYRLPILLLFLSIQNCWCQLDINAFFTCCACILYKHLLPYSISLLISLVSMITDVLIHNRWYQLDSNAFFTCYIFSKTSSTIPYITVDIIMLLLRTISSTEL